MIAMKTTGVGGILSEQGGSLEEALRYVWSLPVSTAILGCQTIEQVDADVKLAVSMPQRQLDATQMSQLREKWAEADFRRLETWKNHPRA